MKIGDLVMVTFPHGFWVTGIFIEDDTVAYGENSSGDKVITRGYVLWDGGLYSTPIDQLEVICGSR